MQGHFFAKDIKTCTGICLGDVPVIQNEQRTTATSPKTRKMENRHAFKTT